MKKKLFIALPLVLLLGYFSLFGVRTTRIQTLRSETSQGVKQGMSSAQVRSFLDARHLDPSGLIRPGVMVYGRGHDFRNQNVVVAVRRNTWRSLLGGESIYLVFVFNDQDELVRWDIFPIYTAIF
jgi:hypothetical protein